MTPAPELGNGHFKILTDPGLLKCGIKFTFVCLVWGLGDDTNEGEFVIQTEEEPNESPPWLPRRFL